MPDDRQVGEGAGDVVAELAAMTAGRAHRIFDNRSAFDVGEGLADGGAGDGDTEFDGSADGIGDKLGRLQVGSWAARGSGVKNLHPHTPGPAFTPLHLVPHRITAGSDSCTPDPEEPVTVADVHDGDAVGGAMRVARVIDPVTDEESFTLLDENGVVAPIRGRTCLSDASTTTSEEIRCTAHPCGVLCCNNFDMTIPSYFSDREFGPAPRDRDTLKENTRDALYAYIGTCINNNWFAEKFPYRCDDGNVICGTEIDGLGTLITGHVEAVQWPMKNAYHMSDADIFDLVEFAAQRVSLPSPLRDSYHKDGYHSIMKHHHLKFDRKAGLKEFRNAVNQLLERGSANFILNEEGRIRRLGSAPVRILVSKLQPDTGDATLDGLILLATDLYMSKDAVQRQIALEKLWDGFERLKTIKGSGDKKKRVQALLSAVHPVDLRTRINAEMLELSNIGNQFQIRHTETDKTPVPDPARDYLFTRMGSMITFILEANELLHEELE